MVNVMKSIILVKMREDLQKSMKSELEYKKNGTDNGRLYEAVISVKYVVRSVLSMFADVDIKPDNATDEDTISLIKKFIFKEKTSELYNQKIFTEEVVKSLSSKELNTLTKEKIFEMSDKLTNLNIGIALSYLPKEATPEEIKDWIIKNIDFSNFKNKMQAMKSITEQFKGVDGNLIKSLIMEM